MNIGPVNDFLDSWPNGIDDSPAAEAELEESLGRLQSFCSGRAQPGCNVQTISYTNGPRDKKVFEHLNHFILQAASCGKLQQVAASWRGERVGGMLFRWSHLLFRSAFLSQVAMSLIITKLPLKGDFSSLFQPDGPAYKRHKRDHSTSCHHVSCSHLNIFEISTSMILWKTLKPLKFKMQGFW